VGDFIATGGGELKDFFEKIAPQVGVTTESFKELSGPQALQLYVSSLEKAGVGQKEMVFYLEAIASDASLLTPILANNGAEMQRLGDRAERYGLVTQDTIDSGRVLRASMGQLSTAFAALGSAIVDTGMVDAMAEVVAHFADFIGLNVAPMVAKVAIALTPLTENVERLGTYVAVAAAIFTGQFVIGLAVAAAATVTLSGALVFLRGALIRTGIGALIVGAGELVYQLTRLVKGAGGFGNAISLLGNVASEVWGRMSLGAGSLVLSMQAVGFEIQAAWVSMLASLQQKWTDFLRGTAAVLASAGMQETSDKIASAAIDAGTAFHAMNAAVQESSDKADAYAEKATAMATAATAALPSIAALRDAMAGADTIGGAPADPNAPGGGAGGGGLGGGGVGVGGAGGEDPEAASLASKMAMRIEALTAALMTEQEVTALWYAQGQEALRAASDAELEIIGGRLAAEGRLNAEHQARMKAVRDRENNAAVTGAANMASGVIGAMSALFGQSKPLAIAQALINTYLGATRALAENPYPANIIAASAVVATGLAQVASIVSAKPGSGGGGGGGASSSAAAAATTQQQQPTQTFQFNIQNDTGGFGESFARQFVDQLNSTQRNGGRIIGVIA
jgi:hypothetical protein